MSRGMIYALTGFAAFALHDALIKSLSQYSVFQTLFFAVLFSHVPFTFYLAADKQERNLRPVYPGWVLLRAVCMVGSGCFAFFAFSTLPLAQAYSLLFTMPLLITVLAIPLLGERVRIVRWLAILLGLAGVLVVLRPGAQTLQWGHFAALAGALCSALSGVITRKIGQHERSATLMLYPLIANILFTGVLLYFVYQPMPFVDLSKMAAIGVLGMAGQYFIILAYMAAPAAMVAPFQYSQMVWAVFYGYLWFGNVPDKFVFMGATLIILAGMMIVWRESTLSTTLRPFLRTRNLRAISAPPVKSDNTAPPDLERSQDE
ncbi:MAG: DMT family transporter [Gammaproteobacteria bacterium]